MFKIVEYNHVTTHKFNQLRSVDYIVHKIRLARIPIQTEEEDFNKKRRPIVDDNSQVKFVVDVTARQHKFSHSNFSINLWALRDVPQPPRSNSDCFTMQLDDFGGEVSFPYCSEMNKLCFRTYWTRHDHYSVHCPTYLITQQPPPVIDLLDAMTNEWNQREQIIEQKRTILENKKYNFENVIKEMLTQETEQKKGKIDKKKKETRKGKKSKKNPKKHAKRNDEYSFGSPHEYDAKAEFVFVEDVEYARQLASMLPDSKALLPDDVSLRSHRITGGIFHFEFLPKFYARRDFFLTNMTQVHSLSSDRENFQTIQLGSSDSSVFLSRSPRISGIEEDKLQAGSKNVSPRISAITMSSKRSFLDIVKDHKEKTNSRLSKFFDEQPKVRHTLSQLIRRNESGQLKSTETERIQITPTVKVILEFKIKLPSHVFWWTTPVICYWEPWEYSEEFLSFPKAKQNSLRHYDAYVENLQKSLFKAEEKGSLGPQIVRDFYLHNIPRKIDFQQICRKIILPALPYNYKNIIDIVLDEQIEAQTRRERRIQLGIPSESFENLQSKNTRPKVESTPPTPLFVPRDRECNFTIVGDQDSEVTSNTNSFLRMASFHSDNNYNVKDGEFTPPKIRFSEYYKLIKSEAATEQIVLPQKDSGILVQIEMKSDENSPNVSKISIKNSQKRRGKRSRGKLNSSERSDSGTQERLSTPRQSILENRKMSYDKLKTMEPPDYPKGRWCTRHITDETYDEETRTITFKSPCFGAYALAAPKYQHMPFKDWELHSHHGKHQHVTLNLTTKFVTMEIHISSEGYSLHLHGKYQNALPKSLQQGSMQFYDFKQALRANGLNIFPERDAACYVEGTSEKHLSMEQHTYGAMACFCRSYCFKHSPWNHLAHRRNIVFIIEEVDKSLAADLVSKSEVLVTPNECYNVNVTEECNLDLDNVTLKYQRHSEGQDYHPDLFFLLKTGLVGNPVKDIDEESANLMFNIAKLLASIRPFSFS